MVSGYVLFCLTGWEKWGSRVGQELSPGHTTCPAALGAVRCLVRVGDAVCGWGGHLNTASSVAGTLAAAQIMGSWIAGTRPRCPSPGPSFDAVMQNLFSIKNAFRIQGVRSSLVPTQDVVTSWCVTFGRCYGLYLNVPPKAHAFIG